MYLSFEQKLLSSQVYEFKLIQTTLFGVAALQNYWDPAENGHRRDMNSDFFKQRLSHLFIKYILCVEPGSFYSYSSLSCWFGDRFIESHWFVWCTQMNHLPMAVEYERDDDWLSMQLAATCNIDQSAFNDWFSGHLNFQIEHQYVCYHIIILPFVCGTTATD